MKLKILNYLMSRFFRAVMEEDVLRSLYGRKLRQGDKIIPESEVKGIITEAKTIKGMKLYKYLIKDLKYSITTKLVREGRSKDDIWFSKGGLWIVDLLEKKIDNLSKM